MRAIEEHQENLLNSLLKWMVVFGGVAYIPSLVACFQERLYTLAVFDTLSYLFLIIVFRSKSTYQIRVAVVVMVMVTMILGSIVLLETGHAGAGHLWLLCSIFLAALFGYRSAIWITIFLSQGILLSYALLQATGIINAGISIFSILAITANMLLLSVTLAFIVNQLLQALRQEIRGQQELLRLLRHRVMNNLQTVESLVSLEKTDPCASTALSRRIQAISIANHLLLAEPDKNSVDIAELLHHLSANVRITNRLYESTAVSPEKLTEVVVGLSDLLEILKDLGPLFITFHDTIQLRSSHRLPSQDFLRSQINESLIPDHWIDLNSSMPSPDTLILNIQPLH